VQVAKTRAIDATNTIAMAMSHSFRTMGCSFVTMSILVIAAGV
jgi:hypothetical protein